MLPPQAGQPWLTLLSRTSANEREKQKSRYYVVSEDTTCSKHTNTMARMSFLERWKNLTGVKGKDRASREGVSSERKPGRGWAGLGEGTS